MMPDNEIPPSLRPAVERFNRLSSELDHDANEAFRLAKESHSAFARRTAFRTVFAAIEGYVFLLKDQVMALFPDKRKYFSDAEVAMLREETYHLDSKGRAVSYPRFLALGENFRFAMEMYMREMLVPLELDLESTGWQAFKTSLSIRHRVTHPRVPEDLEVSEEDFSKLEATYRWVHATMAKNMARSLLAFRQKMYILLEKNIPHQILESLDVMSEEPRTIFEAKQIELLVKLGVFEGPSDSAKLTFLGQEFLKWRKNKHSN